MRRKGNKNYRKNTPKPAVKRITQGVRNSAVSQKYFIQNDIYGMTKISDDGYQYPWCGKERHTVVYQKQPHFATAYLRSAQYYSLLSTQKPRKCFKNESDHAQRAKTLTACCIGNRILGNAFEQYIKVAIRKLLNECCGNFCNTAVF